MKVLYVMVGLLLASAQLMALPLEVTVTQPTKLELMKGDHVSGTIGLAKGVKLAVIDAADNYVLVRYRNTNGRVLAAHTDLPQEKMMEAEPEPEVAPPKAVRPPPIVASPPAPVRHDPANALERALAGKLVRLDGGSLRPFDGAQLAGVKYYAVYFSASWCGPCREFTPGLVDAYAKIREVYPEFELVLVNRDQSAQDMEAYMRGDQMRWPAVRWDAIQGASELNRYAGDGIPCLVLVNENGEVLSDSYRWGRYVGPDAVLDDTWKILRDYRRNHPRKKI